jgi:glyoxylase-like metal-dependent hydrolase (beta-lactamase superfamily II)
MIIDTFVLGDFETNCFCVRQNEEASDCLIIDPGMGAEVLVQRLKEQNYTPVEILLTHGHADHIGGVEALRQHWPKVRVSIHKDDADMLTNPTENLSLMAGVMVQARPAEVLLNSEDAYYEGAGLRGTRFLPARLAGRIFPVEAMSY